MSLLNGDLAQYTCSRAGCGARARWRLGWRNPKIHAADREKVWLACEDHRDFLRDFLAARDFPLTVTELDSDANDLEERSAEDAR